MKDYRKVNKSLSHKALVRKEEKNLLNSLTYNNDYNKNNNSYYYYYNYNNNYDNDNNFVKLDLIFNRN